MSSFHRLARIEATAGLQISQPLPAAAVGEHVGERPELLRLDDREQLGPRVRKVLAQMIDDRLAGLLQFGLEQVGHQRHAAAAAGAGLGAAFEGVERVDALARESPRRSRPLVTLLHEQTWAESGIASRPIAAPPDSTSRRSVRAAGRAAARRSWRASSSVP